MEELQKEGNIMKMGHGDFLTKHSFVHDLGPLTCPVQRLWVEMLPQAPGLLEAVPQEQLPSCSDTA